MTFSLPVFYIVFILVLLLCTVLTKRSFRSCHNAVGWLESSIIIPTFGNLIIIFSHTKLLLLLGYYIYYLGIDLVLTSLVNFTNQYCTGIGNGTQKPTPIYFAIGADVIQILLNIFFGHAFDVRIAEKASGVYSHELIPHFGQTIHHVINYFVLLCVTAIFILAAAKTPKIYRERYTVILASVIIIEILQAHFIFISNSHDITVIGYGIMGLMIFYFVIVYRPLRLLDQMLSNIVSNLSDAFYIFDINRKCIWANEQGCKLVGIKEKNYDKINEILLEMFGKPEEFDEKIVRRIVGKGDDVRFYTLEIKQSKASNGRSNGFYLRVCDITAEQRELKARDEQIGLISQEADRDALTGVGNKSLYNKKVDEINRRIITDNLTEFAVVMVAINNLKYINDEYGHKAGDAYIKGCCQMIVQTFTTATVFRIGGDEFAVILEGKEFEERFQKIEILRNIYDETFRKTELDPWLRYSAAVGIAEHASDDNSYELVLKRADKAMYEEKRKLKKKYGSYR